MVFLFFIDSRKGISSPKETIVSTYNNHCNDRFSNNYPSLGENILVLHNTGTPLELPDLRNDIFLYAHNQRPDKSPSREQIYIGLRDSCEYRCLSLGEPSYLKFHVEGDNSHLAFSPNNTPTLLWIEPSLKNEQVFIQLKMQSPSGQILQEPKALSYFPPKQCDFFQTQGETWEIDNIRVDPALLIRQKARWYGKDLFLKEHGGEEFSSFQNKERLDFENQDNRYLCFVEEGDYLVWNNGRWYIPKLGEDTENLPLLHVQKIEERLLRCELWESGGKARILLNLAKSIDIWPPNYIQHEFKFLGSRARQQLIVEMGKKRLILNPYDWLLRVNDDWIPLCNEEDIDQYVNGQLKGELFIFDSLVKKEGQQKLIGHLFNISRTEMQIIEIPLQQGNNSPIFSSPVEKNWSKEKPPQFVSSDQDESYLPYTQTEQNLMKLPKAFKGNATKNLN